MLCILKSINKHALIYCPQVKEYPAQHKILLDYLMTTLKLGEAIKKTMKLHTLREKGGGLRKAKLFIKMY